MNETSLRSTLRIIRTVSLIGICVVAGFFAGRLIMTPSNETPAMPRTAVETPDAVPDIRLSDLQGNVHSLRDWSEGPLLINFWATWCAPCLREMPLLETVWQARGDTGLTIVGVAVDRTEAVAPYVEKTGVTYPILVGQSDAMDAAEAFGPDFAGLPYSVFAAAGGRLIGVYSGELHAERLDRILDILDDVSAGRIGITEARALIAD